LKHATQFPAATYDLPLREADPAIGRGRAAALPNASREIPSPPSLGDENHPTNPRAWRSESGAEGMRRGRGGCVGGRRRGAAAAMVARRGRGGEAAASAWRGSGGRRRRGEEELRRRRRRVVEAEEVGEQFFDCSVAPTC
jgi:hypothetical protein